MRCLLPSYCFLPKAGCLWNVDLSHLARRKHRKIRKSNDCSLNSIARWKRRESTQEHKISPSWGGVECASSNKFPVATADWKILSSAILAIKLSLQNFPFDIVQLINFSLFSVVLTSYRSLEHNLVASTLQFSSNISVWNGHSNLVWRTHER